MDYLGEEGYIKNAKMLMEHTEKLKAELLKVPELQLVGKPIMNVFAITSKDSSAVNVFILADKLQEKGWHVDRQYKPDAIHFILNPHHLLHIEKFLFDFEASVSETRQALKDNKSIEGNAGVYGLVAKIPKGFNSMVKKEIKKIMTKMYHLGHDEYSDSLELPQDDWKVNLLKRVLKVFKP
jgi:hypothetical protein